MKVIISLILLTIAGLIGFMLWASRPWTLHERKVIGEIINIEPDIMVDMPEHPTVVKVMTWNMGFLYGLGSVGPGYEPKDSEFYQTKIEQVIKLVQDAGPDVLCLQEVDFESSRTHFLDAAKIVARRAGYPYVAEAPSWEANYIPFPYWPFSRHFGRMKSGGAVLSKYPLLDHQVQFLEKPMGQPWWYNLFYLHRYFQKVTIQIGDKKYKLINLHLEAFDKKDRQEQVKKLVDLVHVEKTDFITGDFNTLPKSATKKNKLSTADDYENDTSYELMMNSGLLDVIPDEIYVLNESRYFTFPSNGPERRLDYIFYHKDLKMMKAEILPSGVSDHLPLKASFQIASPKFHPYEL